ncbi:hypothetical protein [Phenylobacterium sp.]|jgi:hypothetical protein|uniref:hypothetical protein n=1 Tax=Phenylobacterium sp. TaxID=1871053 RepID=UPI002E329D38|nr:hypothetical protein [Phenylobacterium sp.]HEX2558894.1 hypothetical protein [Phenylobacterium sp.]
MSSTDRSPDPAKVGATRARQGRWGFHVLLVLVIGTALAAVALFGSWAWKSDDLAESNANNGPAAEAPVFNAPEPQAIQTPPGTKSAGQQAPENVGPAPGATAP